MEEGGTIQIGAGTFALNTQLATNGTSVTVLVGPEGPGVLDASPPAPPSNYLRQKSTHSCHHL